MGKAQSKSVNITTEPTKEIQEGSGELKKLDDSHFKETDSSVSVATAANAVQCAKLINNRYIHLSFFLSLFLSLLIGQRKQGR